MANKKSKRDLSARQGSGDSMANLPVAVFYEIILKLSTWSIVMTKSVCKTWYGLISDPHFAKLHFAQAKPGPLFEYRHGVRIILDLLEPEVGDDFDAGHRWCDFSKEKGAHNRCHHIKKFKSVLKIPLTNVQVHSVDKLQALTLRKLIFYTRFLDFRVIGSCNGLLCFSESLKYIVVCNPITNEFINLPKPRFTVKTRGLLCFGFSPKSSQYKVFQVPTMTENAMVIHTLGKNTWRRVCVVPLKWKMDCGVSRIYFNGAFYWFCSRDTINPTSCIACFDLEDERMRSSIPLPLCLNKMTSQVGVSVLRDQLCVYGRVDDFMKIWTMDEYGVSELWTILISIKISSSQPFKPLRRSSDGAFLMFDETTRMLVVYSDKSGGLRFKSVKSSCPTLMLRAIVHTPSFVSLKDMVDTNARKVFDVNLGCEKINLMDDAHPLMLECIPGI